jgi:heat shock protein HslJ
MIRLGVLALVGLLPTCQGDETVAGYGAAGATWQLTELEGQPFAATATLSFAQQGQLEGEGPCNRFSASMTVPYPWFKAGPVLSTKIACPALDAETAFFTALATMSQSEVLGDTLILRDDAGREMVFKASD